MPDIFEDRGNDAYDKEVIGIRKEAHAGGKYGFKMKTRQRTFIKLSESIL